MTDDGKMVMLHFICANFVKWVDKFSNLPNSCMCKDVIYFGEPSLKFFRMKLELYLQTKTKVIKEMKYQNYKCIIKVKTTKRK